MLFPVTVLVGVSAILFGPLLGTLYALIGAMISGAATFAIGRRLSRETVRGLAGRRLNDLSRRLGERGLLAIVFVRVVPVGPFSIVNIVAGASHIRWRDFILGTLIGPSRCHGGIDLRRSGRRCDSRTRYRHVCAGSRRGRGAHRSRLDNPAKLHTRVEARREPVPQVHGS